MDAAALLGRRGSAYIGVLGVVDERIGGGGEFGSDGVRFLDDGGKRLLLPVSNMADMGDSIGGC